MDILLQGTLQYVLGPVHRCTSNAFLPKGHYNNDCLFFSVPLSTTSQQILPVSDTFSPFCYWKQQDREACSIILESPLPSISNCSDCRRNRCPLPCEETVTAWNPAEELEETKNGFPLVTPPPQMYVFTINSKKLQEKNTLKAVRRSEAGLAFIILTVHECHGDDELTTYLKRLLLRYSLYLTLLVWRTPPS